MTSMLYQFLFFVFFLTRCALGTLEQQPNSDSVIVRKMHHRCHQEGRTISRQAYNRHIVGIDLNKNKTVRFARRCVFQFSFDFHLLCATFVYFIECGHLLNLQRFTYRLILCETVFWSADAAKSNLKT